MACYKPLYAWRTLDGTITFGKEPENARELQLPCGKCIGCRITRQRSWTLRILHEQSMTGQSSFVTLTYDEEHYEPSLNYQHYQAFMKALRKKYGPTRFFAVGEYGSKTKRPHFHAILFGRWWDNGTPVGKNIFSHPELTQLWTKGFSSYGQVTYQSAAYVAGYCLKKQDKPEIRYSLDERTGELAELTPEMTRMSLKPGLGTTWFKKYWKETHLARDGIVQPGGQQLPSPKYYDKLLESQNPDLMEWRAQQRQINARPMTRRQREIKEQYHKGKIRERTL